MTRETECHIHSPECKSDTFRILPKRCSKFIEETFQDFEEALRHGLDTYSEIGFRVFRQKAYEWYAPTNIEVAKIAESKKWRKK